MSISKPARNYWQISSRKNKEFYRLAQILLRYERIPAEQRTEPKLIFLIIYRLVEIFAEFPAGEYSHQGAPFYRVFQYGIFPTYSQQYYRNHSRNPCQEWFHVGHEFRFLHPRIGSGLYFHSLAYWRFLLTHVFSCSPAMPTHLCNFWRLDQIVLRCSKWRVIRNVSLNFWWV